MIKLLLFQNFGGNVIKSYFQAKECKYIIDAYESIINDIEMLKAAGEW